MAVFGEYDIRNEFDISLELESLIKILAVSEQDEIFASHSKETLDVSKTIEDNTLNASGVAEGQSVTMTEPGLSLTGTRTNPNFNINKQIIETTLNGSGSAEGQSVTLLDTSGSNSTRINPYFDISKVLNASHVINDGTTVDTESVLMLDTSGSNSTRTNPYFVFSKLLNSTTLNYNNVLDNNTVTMIEPEYPMASGTRTGLSIIDITKPLSDTQTISDTTGVDLNRTVPALSLVTTFNTAYYDFGTMTYAGNNTATATDSGGFIDFNPYGEAGFFLNDGGLYVGDQIDF